MRKINTIYKHLMDCVVALKNIFMKKKQVYRYDLVKKNKLSTWTGTFETKKEALDWAKKNLAFWESRGKVLKLVKIKKQKNESISSID